MVGMFDVAVSGEDEQRIQKQAQTNKLNAAIYDVRERHGEWLFGARDIDGFNDRAKLAHVSICQTIEPHLHARTGVHRRVMKALEREWRQRQADISEDSMANTIDTGLANAGAGPKGMKTPRMPRQHVQGPQLMGSYRHAIPEPGEPTPGGPQTFGGIGGPPSNIGLEVGGKPAAGPAVQMQDTGGNHWGRRYYADGPSVEEDPERAHAIFDRANELVDEVAGFGPDMMPPQDPVGGMGDPAGGMPPEAPPDQFAPPQPDPQQQPDPALLQARRRQARGVECPQCGKYLHDEIDRAGHQHGADGQEYNADPQYGFESRGDYQQRHACYPGCHENEAHSKKFHKDKEKESRRQAADDHPELHTNITYSPHTGEELHGSGDFEAYKDSVDQGAPEKVNRDFVPGSHDMEHHPDVHHNFDPGYKEASEYYRISRMLYADASAPPGMPAMPDMSGGAAASGSQAPMGQGGNPTAAEVAPPPAAATETPPAGATPPATPMMPMASREYQIISAMLRQAVPIEPAQPAGGTEAPSTIGSGNWSQGPTGPIHFEDQSGAAAGLQHAGSRHYADRNYLQQADEALTKVLNEKAEEFQNTIAPLQAALQTIQEAEQLTNPLNVSPPAGTVNVLPQGAQGQQSPQGQGGLGASPAAAGLAAQPQQMQARRGRHPFE